MIITSIPKKFVPNKNGYVGMAVEQSLQFTNQKLAIF